MDQPPYQPPLMFGGHPPPFNPQHLQPQQLHPQQPQRVPQQQQQQLPLQSPTNKQVILVLDGSAGGESAKSILIGDDNSGPLQRFVTKHSEQKNQIDFCMVVYRGYPSGSELSVQCSQLTSDFKHFIRWLDLVKFEGGGRRNHALTEGLYYASQFCDPRVQNYVIVFTGSEYSNLTCMSDKDKTPSKILKEMAQKNACISLFCTRKIESLRQLWFESLGESVLQVVEENHQLWLLWGLDLDKKLTKVFKWLCIGSTDNRKTQNQFQFQANLHIQNTQALINMKIDPKSWSNVLDIKRYVNLQKDLPEKIKERLVTVHLNKVRSDDSQYESFVKYLQTNQVFAHLECNTVTGECMIIYARTSDNTLFGLLFNNKQKAQQPPSQGTIM